MRRPLINEKADNEASIQERLEKRCPCCNKIYATEKYNITEDPDNFAIHGFGISLYFAMVRYCIYITLILLVGTMGIFTMYYNGGLNANNIINFNKDIKDEDRIAGNLYTETFYNSWSLGRSNLVYNMP